MLIAVYCFLKYLVEATASPVDRRTQSSTNRACKQKIQNKTTHCVHLPTRARILHSRVLKPSPAPTTLTPRDYVYRACCTCTPSSYAHTPSSANPSRARAACVANTQTAPRVNRNGHPSPARIDPAKRVPLMRVMFFCRGRI